MSMAVLAPIFPYVSAMIGIVIGCIIGAWFALLFSSLRHRSFPIEEAEELLIRPILFAIPLIAGFFFFRYVFGLQDFSIAKSVSHIAQELLVERAAWFFAGTLFGLIGTLLMFVSGILHKSARTRDSAVFRDSRSAWEI